MPYSIDWYIENEIIYLYYFGENTVNDLRESLSEVVDMCKKSPHPLVHILTDVSNLSEPVSLKESLEVIREVGTDQKMGWNVVLGEKSTLMKLGIAFGASIFKTRNRAVDTLEEAEAFLAEKDITLNWDKVNKSVIKFKL